MGNGADVGYGCGGDSTRASTQTELMHGLDELPKVDWLPNIAVRAERVPLHEIAILGRRGQNHNGEQLCFGVGAHALQHLQLSSRGNLRSRRTTCGSASGPSNRRPATRTLAIFADPVFDPGDVRVRASRAAAPSARSPLALSRRLTRLPFSRDEAEQIAAMAPAAATRKALDFDASRALAMSRELADFRVVHFATHAVQDSDHPELSGIVLSLVDPSGAPRDGFLRLHDLYTLRLNGDLAVLSACDTALPRGRHGVATLADGLFAAGVPRVISTLWKIDDEASSALVVSFYRFFLTEGRSPAAALAAAQRAMANDRRFGDAT